MLHVFLKLVCVIFLIKFVIYYTFLDTMQLGIRSSNILCREWFLICLIVKNQCDLYAV